MAAANEPESPWKAHGIVLSETEEAWLRQNPVVRLSGDPAWPPYSSFNKSSAKFEGADFDLFRVLAERLGIQIVEVPAASWEEVWTKTAVGKVDVVASTSSSPERRRLLHFTTPHISMPVAIVARQGAPFLLELRDLPPGMRAAGPSGYITTERLALDHPSIPLRLTRTSEEALRMVAAGDADFVVENLGVVSHYIHRNRLTNLKIAGFTEDRFDLSYGIRRELPLLHSALEKALASMSKAEKAKIMSKWLATDYSPGLPWRAVLAGSGMLLLAVFGGMTIFAWHNRSLKTEIERRRKIEAELRVANERLSTLNEEKSQFMRMAAHDLRNPLSGILNTIALLQELNRSLDERTMNYLREVEDNAYRMLRLMRNLLDADAIERGQTNLRPQAVDLRSAVQAVLKRFHYSAARKRIDLQSQFEEFEAVPRIVADPDALGRILDNLVSNAIKFTPSGGGVSIHIKGPFLKDGDATLSLSVCDSGPGIDVDDLSKLFEAHAQLKTRPTNGEDSHGLGLSIVKRLCAAMGGSVRCEDQPGGGACFVVELSAADAEVVPPLAEVG